MALHRNARLGLAGRRALVADVEAGCSCREAARRRGVSPTTACKWWRRWSQASLEERSSLACLEDRSSPPHRSPRLLAASEQALICAARRRSGWGRGHSDERAATVTAFVERGFAYYAAHGIEPKWLLSDNAVVYCRNRFLRELLGRRGLRHLLIPIRRPQVREWALGRIYRSSEHRAQALSHWLRYSNERRPHSSLGGRSPISRVHNVPRQDR